MFLSGFIANARRRVLSVACAVFLALSFMVAVPGSAFASVSPKDPFGLGRVGFYFGSGKEGVWLGAQLPRPGLAGVPYCVEGGNPPPRPGMKVVSVSSLTAATPRLDGLSLTVPQMAWILDKYGASRDPGITSAVALLVHSNFEASGGKEFASARASVDYIIRQVRANKPSVESMAKELRAQAIGAAVAGYQKGSYTGEGQRSGVIHSLGVTNAAGVYVAGIDVTVTLSGPAVFKSTGSAVWSGKTGSVPLSLEWRATGNGDAKYNVRYRLTSAALKLINSGTGVQKTLVVNTPDPEVKDADSPWWRVIYDFQPRGVSHVRKISATGSFTDVLDAQADPGYGSGKWISADEGWAKDFGLKPGPVPVTYRVSAYYTGENPPALSSGVPGDAVLIATKYVTASGPGKIAAVFKTGRPGFVTVVWEVVKAEQGRHSELIHQDWRDGYGLEDETVSHPHTVNIDSSMSVRATKSGVYLVDDLWVTGLPHNHGDFSGAGRFAADEKFITQDLLFFPEGVKVSEENRARAEKIGETVQIPARNGFYPSVGSTSFRMPKTAGGGLKPGTYVFVTSFKGDDRVFAYRSSVEDKTEQYTVPRVPKPVLTSFASGLDGKQKVFTAGPDTVVKDRVCDVNKALKPGSRYRLVSDLVAKSDGSSVLKEKPVTVFTAGESRCVDVKISFDSTSLADSKAVVFQTLQDADGKTLAVHGDVSDESQTVSFVKPPKPVLTSFASGLDGKQKVFTAGPDTVVKDRVCDVNKALKPGSRYRLVSDLVAKSDGSSVLKEKPVTVFTAGESRCVDVKISFDSTSLADSKAVVFQTLQDADGKTLAVHGDVSDESQTVSFVKPPETPFLSKTGSVAGALAVSGAGACLAGFFAKLWRKNRRKGVVL